MTKKGRPNGAKNKGTCPHCGKTMEPPTGNCYQRARMRAGLSLTEAARKTGVVYTTLWNYESGDRDPSIPIARKMAAAYGCTLDELAGPEPAEVEV